MSTSKSYLTMEKNAIRYMLKYIEEFEQIKNKKHPIYKNARKFFKEKGICFQNFYKFYARFIESGRNEEELLPQRRGRKPKYKELPGGDKIVDKVLEYREKRYNRYMIAEAIRNDEGGKEGSSASTVYRILRKLGKSRLNQLKIETKRKIERKEMGSLVHVDCHYLAKGIVKEEKEKRYYVMGIIDTKTRLAWVELIERVKGIETGFAMMDAIMIMKARYGMEIEEVLTDNGSEFCGGEKKREHGFERVLMYFGIKHRRTQAYRPQTNGKIERYWRTFNEEVIEGAEFESIEELREEVLGYNIYYNEYRPHQGINGKKPIEMVKEEDKNMIQC